MESLKQTEPRCLILRLITLSWIFIELRHEIPIIKKKIFHFKIKTQLVINMFSSFHNYPSSDLQKQIFASVVLLHAGFLDHWRKALEEQRCGKHPLWGTKISRQATASAQFHASQNALQTNYRTSCPGTNRKYLLEMFLMQSRGVFVFF